MSGAQIRPARVEDAAAIGRVRVKTWRAAYAGIVDADLLAGLVVDDADLQRRRRYIAEPAARTHTLVADLGGTVVGFVVAGPSRDEDAGEATGEIYALYVDPAYWGTGVGRRLMAAGLDALRDEGFHQVTLWVLEGNARGRRFYESGGLSADGARKLLDMPGDTPEVRYAGPL